METPVLLCTIKMVLCQAARQRGPGQPAQPAREALGRRRQDAPLAEGCFRSPRPARAHLLHAADNHLAQAKAVRDHPPHPAAQLRSAGKRRYTSWLCFAYSPEEH